MVVASKRGRGGKEREGGWGGERRERGERGEGEGWREGPTFSKVSKSRKVGVS